MKILEKESIKSKLEVFAIFVKRRTLLGVKFYKVIKVAKWKGKSFYNSFFSFLNPLSYLSLDFSSRSSFRKKSLPLYLDFGDCLKLFGGRDYLSLLEVDGFPFTPSSLYFSVQKLDVLKHSLIVGQTGVGKSKFLELLIKKIYALDENYTVILIDPHASLEKEFLNFQAPKTSFDFINTACNFFLFPASPKSPQSLWFCFLKLCLRILLTAGLSGY